MLLNLQVLGAVELDLGNEGTIVRHRIEVGLEVAVLHRHNKLSSTCAICLLYDHFQTTDCWSWNQGSIQVHDFAVDRDLLGLEYIHLMTGIVNLLWIGSTHSLDGGGRCKLHIGHSLGHLAIGCNQSDHVLGAWACQVAVRTKLDGGQLLINGDGLSFDLQLLGH